VTNPCLSRNSKIGGQIKKKISVKLPDSLVVTIMGALISLASSYLIK